jgi:hypothetical protein
VYKTTYDAEIFYPDYFDAPRPVSTTGYPKSISYGGPAFTLTLASTSLTPATNLAGIKVALIRTGFSTHGVKYVSRLHFRLTLLTRDLSQYGNEVHRAGDLVLPPQRRISHPLRLATSSQPRSLCPWSCASVSSTSDTLDRLITDTDGPRFVVVDGIPSIGVFTMVGSGQLGKQPLSAATVLPASSSSAGVAAGGSSSGSEGTATGGVRAVSAASRVSALAQGWVLAGVVVAGACVVA